MNCYPVGTNITWMLYECSILVGIFWTIYVLIWCHMNVQFWLECHAPKMNIPATFRSEHFWNVQIWHYINIKLRYFLFHENWTVTKCFHCTDNFQCSEKNQNPKDSFSIQLWTFYEHSHLNIHTISILNYEGIIFECSPKHSLNVPWMLLCPLGILSWGHRHLWEFTQ